MMLQPGGVKIWRPRQVRLSGNFSRFYADRLACEKIYVGSGKRDYIPIEDRVPVEELKQTPSAVQHTG